MATYVGREIKVSNKYHAESRTSDPATEPVLIVGQLKNLQKVNFQQVKNKLMPRVSIEVSVSLDLHFVLKYKLFSGVSSDCVLPKILLIIGNYA